MSIRILIVEDNPSILALLGATFTPGRRLFDRKLARRSRERLHCSSSQDISIWLSPLEVLLLPPNIKGSERLDLGGKRIIQKKFRSSLLSAEANDQFFGKLLERENHQFLLPETYPGNLVRPLGKLAAADERPRTLRYERKKAKIKSNE